QQVVRWGGFGLALEPSTLGMADLVTNNPATVGQEAASLPSGGRVLFVGEARGFGFPTRFTAPSQHDLSPLRNPIESLPSAQEVRGWLTAQGYTHLLVNAAELRRLAPRYPIAPWRTEEGRRRFEALLETLGPPLIQRGEVAIFKL